MLEEEDIPDDLKIVLFRVMQEAFHNIAKHGKAQRVCLTLGKAGGRIELVIEDDGRGFDPEAVASGHNAGSGFGLTGMKERTELSGGSFSIHSRIGKGTTVRASWPST
jgi:signal transduction histidine kinase